MPDNTSFMSKLRDKMTIVFWFALIFFVAMVIFRWGAGVSGPEGEGEEKKNVIATVKGREIDYKDYTKTLERLRNQAISEGRRVNEQVEHQIREQAFNQLINDKLMSQEYESKNVEITGEELWEELKNNPPKQIRQNEAFRTNGRFDMRKYRRKLRSPGANWSRVEQYMRSRLPRKELKQIINTMVFPTSIDAKEDFLMRNKKVKINYAKYLPKDVSFTELDIDTSQSSLKKFYNNNKERFRQKKLAVMDYVSLPVVPTAQDTEKVLERIRSIRKQIEEGQSFQVMAKEYSEDPQSARRGGKLGYIRPGQMVPPFDKVAFALADSELSKPVKTKHGYHLIYVTDHRYPEESQRVSDTVVLAHHILRRFDASAATRDSVRGLMDQLKGKAKAKGLPKAAKEMEFETHRTAPFGPDEEIQGIGYDSGLNNFAFKADTGDLYRVIPGQDNYYLYELVSRQQSGIPSFASVKEEVVRKYIKQRKTEFLKRKAEKLTKQLKSDGSLATLAEKYGAEAGTTGYFSQTDYIPGIGREPAVIGVAFGLTESEPVSSPFIDSQSRVFVLELVDKKMPADSVFRRRKNKMVQQIFADKKEKVYNDWFLNLRDQSNIEDNRLSILGAD